MTVQGPVSHPDEALQDHVPNQGDHTVAGIAEGDLDVVVFGELAVYAAVARPAIDTSGGLRLKRSAPRPCPGALAQSREGLSRSNPCFLACVSAMASPAMNGGPGGGIHRHKVVRRLDDHDLVTSGYSPTRHARTPLLTFAYDEAVLHVSNTLIGR